MSFERLSLGDRRTLFNLVACFSCATAALWTGCAKQETGPEAEALPVTNPPSARTLVTNPSQASRTPEATTTTTSANLQVGKELIDACNLNLNSVENAPKFDFDQSVLLPDDRTVLDQIAKCVTTGPLQGRQLHLIGRADPRGEVEYNMVLGESRADSVRDYLMSLGVPKENLTETSRGKLDATGTDEATWRIDRRVDVDLM
jgi:peptidoglycan-associated lipoprotein